MSIGTVTIGDYKLPVDVKQMIRRPIGSMRQLQDQGIVVGEQTLDNSALWRRKADDFILGQGQDFFDQTDENSRRRQRAISGFDPLGDRRSLAVSLAMGGGVAAYNGGTAGVPKLLRTRSNWWVIPTTTGTIKRTNSLTDFTENSVSGTTAALDATVNGDTVYIADGSSVFSGSISGTSVSSFSTVDTDSLDAVKGRLICGKGPLLFELSSAGAQIEIFTHPNSSWDWVDFCGGSVGIYCAGHDGLKSEIYLSTLIDATGAIQAPGSVAEFPAGELIRAIDFFQGLMVIGTNKGVRIATATQGGLLDVGPLIELGDVYGVLFEGQYAYATCSSLPVFGGPGVVKLDVSRFSSPYVPAYAGAYPITASNYTAYGVGSAGDTIVCLLGNGTQVQLQKTTAGTYGTGQMWTGLITFGVDEPKNVESVEVRFDALGTGQSVTLDIYDEQGGTLLASSTQATIGATELILDSFNEILLEGFELKLTAIGGVVIRRWTARAVPAPSRIPEEFILPVDVHRQVTLDDGAVMQMDGLVVWQYLTELMKSRSRVDLQFGNETISVWVDQVGIEGTMENWKETGQWPEGLILVRLVTVL